MKTSQRIFISLIFLSLSLPASAAINAWLDHDQVNQGESVQLTLQHDGQTSSQPDLSPIKQDFAIVEQSSGSKIQIINGKMNSQVEVNLTLIPKHSGKLHIPALQWDGQSSQFLPLTVTSNAEAAAQSGSAAKGTATANVPHIFITSTMDQKQPYVQAAVTLTTRLYVDEALYQASLELQPNNDVLVQQLGQDKQTTEVRNGNNYHVIERKYLLFPQRSGHIQLDGPILNAQVQDTSSNNDPFGNSQLFNNAFGRNPFSGMLNTTKPVRIQGDSIVLNIRPRPASANAHDWLPATDVTLTENWQPNKEQIHVGDPITRHLQLSAEPLTATQLPDLSRLMQLPAGLRAYPDQPKLDTKVQGNSIIGNRDQDIAIIASKPGHYEIPAIHLFWWDTAKNMQKEIDLPARKIDVLAGTAAISTETTTPIKDSILPTETRATPSAVHLIQNAATNQVWMWLSLTFALLWLGTLAAWWRSSAQRVATNKLTSDKQAVMSATSAPRMTEARQAFWQACRDNDPQAARRQLLDWARTTWPQDPPIGLKSLAERLDETTMKPLLSQLDRACYTNEAWQGAALLNLKKLSNQQRPVTQKMSELDSLYPK
ncbi:hypothetical protein GALL_111860 [mine drainage metagenome]|uniref:DUF7939 domain-containing protein n=1 Tax=mine drainage metagenome TaxID=410659 RepID=A0A1J5SRC5_9ZZZZ